MAGAENTIEGGEAGPEQSAGVKSVFSANALDYLKDYSPAKPNVASPDVLVLDSPYKEKTAEPERVAETERTRVDVSESDNLPLARKWTMAVSLTSSSSVEHDGVRRQVGAQSKLKEILALAESTRERPVTIYVQAPLPGVQTERPDGTLVTTFDSREVATYRLENGHIALVERGETRGFQKDLEHLLARASARAGDGHLGLIIQSHGFAGAGLGGDSGKSTLAELELSLTNGLKASGRSALDLLSFDACSMGNMDVVQALQGEARHVVASAELEFAFSDADGQNLRAALNALVGNPDMTPGDYASRFVELAREGLNDDSGNLRPDMSGTETLAHFDVSRFSDLDLSLSRLGGELSAIVNNQEKKSYMVGLIESLGSFRRESFDSGGFRATNRDLGLFLNALDSAIHKGELPDPNGSLSQSVRDVRASVQNLVRSYHGEPYNGYDRMAGLSVFLPGAEIQDVDALVQQRSAIAGALKYSQTGTKFTTFDNLDFAAENLQRHFAELRSVGDIQNLESLLTKLRQSGNQNEMDMALDEISRELKHLMGSPIAENLHEPIRRQVLREREELLREQLMRSPALWANFIQSLTKP